MENSACSAGQDPFRRILSEMIQQKIENGMQPESILDLLQEIMAYVQEIIEGIEAAGQSPLVSCMSGCSYCCHSNVKIIPLEALLIFSFVEHHFTEAQILALKLRIEKNSLLTSDKTVQERFINKDNTPCVFLKTGCCSIYSVRPFICRSWNSLDHLACKAAYESDHHHTEIETSIARNYMFSTAKELFQEMTGAMALDSGILEIPSAIQGCFNQSDPFHYWLEGGRLFS